MGYMNKLTQAAQPASAPPAPAPAQATDPAQTPTRLAAAPAATSAAKQPEAALSAAVPAADPAASHVADPAQEAPASKTLSLELSTPAQADDDAAKRAHEAAEAKRKAEWEAKQAEKKAARQKQLDKIKAMNDTDLLAASLQRVSDDTEKMTRRNMKEAVAKHISAKCRENAAFARHVMLPDKSMMHCYWYICRKAKEFIQKELKANGVEEESGVYGEDVPDELVYQWAVDYFNDPDAQEDKEREETFIPKPYIPTSSASKPAAKPKPKPKPKKETPKPTVPKPKGAAVALEQMSLL